MLPRYPLVINCVLRAPAGQSNRQRGPSASNFPMTSAFDEKTSGGYPARTQAGY